MNEYLTVWLLDDIITASYWTWRNCDRQGAGRGYSPHQS